MSPKVICLPSRVVTGILSRSRSARGSCATGPSPRHTLGVGPSSRIWLNAQRVAGNLPLDPSLKRTGLSTGGGKPCITLLATGSVCAAPGSFGASSARTSWAKVVSASANRLAPANMDARRALRRVMAFPRIVFVPFAAVAVWQDSVYPRSVAKTMRDREGSIEPLARLFSDLADLRDTGRPLVLCRLTDLMSVNGMGRVKTPTFNLRVEIPSRFRKFENQKCLRPLLREDDRENNSAHSWLLHVFTQPGQKAKYSLRAHIVRFAPESGLKSDIAAGPVR